ncbi:MAG: hypothetical protein RDV41_00635 [Planctomycetota bacterium]|nr:hypothetical protein [Planctomycetota bacterium]
MTSDSASAMHTDLERELLTALRRHLTTAGFHVAPDIPPKKLAAALKSCGVPSAERVLALLDCTVLGSATDGLLVGLEGVYYHNDWSGKSAGSGVVRYRELLRHRIEDGGFMEVSLGGNHYVNVAGCSASKKEVLEILADVQEAIWNVKKLRPDLFDGPGAVESQRVAVSCSACGAIMNVSQSLLGGSVVCANCGARVTV